MASDDLENQIKGLKLSDKTDINILLLGETGVGKSTFINSIANYLTYIDLKKAEKEKLFTLIPSKFNVTDKHDKNHIIHIGTEKDQNEYLDTGVSATQDVKTYVFAIWEGQTKVRLIDTPGMGDTRGVQQDDINCENILSYIGQLHELHAICFLFRPTNTRITKFFGYCMSQILSRLDKSASNNIIFIFTNTRGTDYGPGDTFPILQQVVKDIEAHPPHVKIPFDKNIFCFDNEAFRYLAAMKQELEFDNSVKQRMSESWRKSVEQCWGLIKYIVGDTKNLPLEPHSIQSTSAINEARRMIIQLAQPLAEITQLIGHNLYLLQRHEENLNVNNNSLEDLRKKLFMPVINLEVTTLTQPVTVCTNKSCAEIYKVGDINKWHYKQRCHDPCYLTNVPKEIIGSPQLVNCAAMNGTRTCQKCNCDFSLHMHVYYLTNTKEDRIVDDNVQKNINSKEKVLQDAKRLIEEVSIRKDELEKEHEIIIKSCARFAHFLQTNAITPFSDFYKDYIQYLIIQEKSLGILSNMAVVHQLEKLLREYEEAKQSFDEALKLQKKLDNSDVFVTPQKINESIEILYKLKHNGDKIRELYDCQKKSRSKEHQYTEYVHNVVSKQKNFEKSKDKKGSDVRQKPAHKTHFPKEESKRFRSHSRHREHPHTPPPPYRETTHYVPWAHTHHPRSGAQYHEPTPPPPPPAHVPSPYASQRPAPDSYVYTPQYDSRDSGYEFSISVKKPPHSSHEARPPTPPAHYSSQGSHPPPQESYHPPQGSYPPSQGSYPPSQGPYPHGSYHPPPQRPYHPSPQGSHHYPQGSYYPPQGSYYPPQGSYHPPHGSYYSHGAYHAQDGYHQHFNPGVRGRGRGRGGRGRGGINKYQKYKPGHNKNNGKKGPHDSDSDSDASVASSHK